MTHTPEIGVGELLRKCEVPPAVAWIVRTLEEQGFETWTVGGSVRDAVLEQPSVDWDFATAARPQQVQKIFRRTVPVGVEHGTVGVLKDGKMFEVTTFRRDIEPQGRRAIVQFADTLEEDLARRDFTLNAIAWHPLRNEVKDPFGGAIDLRAKILRAVGKAEERFREDYLRILRGLRFAGRMGLDIEAETWAAMTSSVDGLTTLSWERVHEELLKVLSSTRRASATLTLYQTSGALAAILPELSQTLDSSADWQRTLVTVDSLGIGDPVLRAAALFAPVAHTHGVATVLATLKRIRFSNADAERIAASIAPPFELPSAEAGPAAARRWAAAAKPAYRSGRLRLALADARARHVLEGVDPRPALDAIRSVRREIRSGRALAISDLAIDGKDVIRLGVRPGPAIGTLLDDLLALVLDTPELNTAEALLERALALIEEGTP